MYKIISLFLACFFQLNLYAHVGSSEVLMQGNAGAYKVLVSVKPPDVIPGLASVKVYVQGNDVSSVSIRAVYYLTGDEGSPRADAMKSAGQPGQYVGEVWIMNGGSSSIQVIVKGKKGEGEMIVPVVAVTTAKKDLPSSTAYCISNISFRFNDNHCKRKY